MELNLEKQAIVDLNKGYKKKYFILGFLKHTIRIRLLR